MRSRIRAFTLSMRAARCAASCSCGLIARSSNPITLLSPRSTIASRCPYLVPMKLLMQTTDPTQIAFAKALLQGEGIDCFELDVNISILEGSTGIFPRRLMVAERDMWRARMTLTDNGLPVND